MGPPSASRVGSKMEVVQDTREKHVRKSLGRKHPRTYQVKPKGAMEKPGLLAISTLKAFIGKETLALEWPPLSSLPRAAGTSSAKSKKEGAATLALGGLTCTDQNQCAWNCRTDRLEGPASGNKHHLGSNLRSPRSASGRW